MSAVGSLTAWAWEVQADWVSRGQPWQGSVDGYRLRRLGVQGQPVSEHSASCSEPRGGFPPEESGRFYDTGLANRRELLFRPWSHENRVATASAKRWEKWWENPRHCSESPANPRDLAERAGFEPALGYSPKHAFQACDLNRSSTSPEGAEG